MSIKIECDECDANLGNGEGVYCQECHNTLIDEKNKMEDELQEKIDTLEEELQEKVDQIRKMNQKKYDPRHKGKKDGS